MYEITDSFSKVEKKGLSYFWSLYHREYFKKLNISLKMYGLKNNMNESVIL